jgi:hypothetical protein
MEAILEGISQVKKAAGIATVAAWILLALAYFAALMFGTFGTFSLQLFHNMFEKSTGVFGTGFGLAVFFGMIFLYPIGDESGKPILEKMLTAFMKTIGWLFAIGLGLLVVAIVLQFFFDLMLAFARWLHYQGIPAWKIICGYITIAWFVLMGCCLAILLTMRRKSEALQAAANLLMESIQEVAEFFCETVWRAFRRSPSSSE